MTLQSAVCEMRINRYITDEFINSGKTPHFAQTFACFSQSQNINLERWTKAESAFFTNNDLNHSKKPIYYIVSENAKDNSLASALGNAFIDKQLRNDMESIMFQLLFTFDQLHQKDMVHGDVHYKNILLKKSYFDWNVYYSMFANQKIDKEKLSGNTSFSRTETQVSMSDEMSQAKQNSGSNDDEAIRSTMFFNPYNSGSENHFIVKIIDFDTMHDGSKTRLKKPLTMIQTRPPEQIICSMRDIRCKDNAPELYPSTTKSDIFSLGIVFLEMLIRIYGNINIAVLCYKDLLPDGEKDAIIINQIVDNFANNQNDINNSSIYSAQFIRNIGEWNYFWQYIKNMVYLLGPPDVIDLFPNKHFAVDELWIRFFSKFKKWNLQPHLQDVMTKFNIPSKYQWLCHNMLRWNPSARLSAKNLIFEHNNDGELSSLFENFLVSGLKQPCNDIQNFIDHQKLESITFCVFGDVRLSQRCESQQKHRYQQKSMYTLNNNIYHRHHQNSSKRYFKPSNSHRHNDSSRHFDPHGRQLVDYSTLVNPPSYSVHSTFQTQTTNGHHSSNSNNKKKPIEKRKHCGLTINSHTAHPSKRRLIQQK